MSDTTLDLDLDLESLLGESPPEDCAHIVRRQGALGAGEIIAYAAEHGLEVEALCGWKWVPKGFAPDNLPACQACIREWERLAAS